MTRDWVTVEGVRYVPETPLKDEIARLQGDLKDARYLMGVWRDKANHRAVEIAKLRDHIYNLQIAGREYTGKLEAEIARLTDELHGCALREQKLGAALEEIIRNGDQGIHVPGPYDIAKSGTRQGGEMSLGGPRIEPTGKVKNLEAQIARLRAALGRIADLYGYEAEANAVAIAREALAKEGK